MHFSKLATLSALLTCSLAAPARPEDQIAILPHEQLPEPATVIRDALISNDIIDEVLDDFKPSWQIDIVYPKHQEQVVLGNDLPVKSLKTRPIFAIRNLNVPPFVASNDSVFTLILTDPDAKSRKKPKMSEMCHWIVTNLTLSLQHPLEPTSLEPGELVQYLPPGPPPKTGPHRYIFVLLEGKRSSELMAPSKRPHWGYGKKRHGIRDWAAENHLTVVGANFFFAQNKKQ